MKDIQKIFRTAWFKLFFELIFVLAIALSVVIIVVPGLKWDYLWLLILLALPFLLLRWTNKLDVPANHVYSVEWLGKFYHLSPGRCYPFPYFGKLRNIESIPANRVVLSILMGVRTGLPDEIVTQFTYGTASNVETEGDYVRLLLKMEIQNVDMIKLRSSHEDPYKYIVGLFEVEVKKFVGCKKTEVVNDEFPKKDWTSVVTDVENRFKILDNLGVKIHSFISVDVLNTPEVEESRRRVQAAENEGRVIDEQIKNKVKLEAGRGKFLDEKILNVKKEKTIGEGTDDILKHTIDTIKKTSDVRGDVALRFINDQNKYTTVQEASRAGGIVYIENGSGGNSNAGAGAAIAWGINATNSAAQKNTSPKSAKDKDNTKTKGPVKGKVANDDDDDDEETK